jgi:hypothetical protein
MMPKVTWNPLRLHLLDPLPNGRDLNAEYCRDNIFTAPVQVRLQVDGTKLIIHANNARPHTI